MPTLKTGWANSDLQTWPVISSPAHKFIGIEKPRTKYSASRMWCSNNQDLGPFGTKTPHYWLTRFMRSKL
jgi:hypothetical protein